MARQSQEPQMSLFWGLKDTFSRTELSLETHTGGGVAYVRGPFGEGHWDLDDRGKVVTAGQINNNDYERSGVENWRKEETNI